MFNMQKKSSILLMFFLLLGCQKATVDHRFLSELSKIDSENKFYVPKNATTYLYVSLDNNEMFATNSLELYDWYKNYCESDYKNYYSFLDSVLNKKTKLKSSIAKNYRYQVFTQNPQIMQQSLTDIIKNYFQGDKKKYFLYPKNLSMNDTQTVLYKMFLEGYLISFDDYGGKYNIVKYN